ncbi:MAG: hypothetical protein V1849_01295, partial [Chloroflexota bacterium]
QSISPYLPNYQAYTPETAVKPVADQTLRYKVPGCTIYRELQEQCGEEVASRMPCRHACLIALRVLHEDLGLPAGVSMLGSMAKDQACQFEARRG